MGIVSPVTLVEVDRLSSSANVFFLSTRRQRDRLVRMSVEIGYREILTALIHKHHLPLFEECLSQIDWEQVQIPPCSTLYIDALFLLHLLEQYLSSEERSIFDFFFHRLKPLLTNEREDLIEIYVDLMLQKRLGSLDALLRVLYTRQDPDYQLALYYVFTILSFDHVVTCFFK